MKKVIIGIVVVGASAFGYWTISPLFLDKVVSESLEDIAEVSHERLSAQEPETQTGKEPVDTSDVETIAVGTFTDVDGFHNGEGTVKVIKTGEKYFVRFEDDFRVTNGPDLFVYFGKDGQYAKAALIGGLKGNIGSQNYEVPVDIDPTAFDEVWIWCRAFAQPFAHAKLGQK